MDVTTVVGEKISGKVEVNARWLTLRQLRDSTATLVGKNAFVFGGKDNQDSMYALDTLRKRWRRVSSAGDKPPSRVCGHTTNLVDDSIYLALGYNEATDNPQQYIYRFDVPTIRWYRLKAYGNQRIILIDHTCDYYDSWNCLLVFGGISSKITWLSNTLFKFDISSMIWTVLKAKGNPPVPRRNHMSSLVENKLYIFGGLGSFRHALDSLYMLELSFSNLVWSKLEPSSSFNPRRLNGSMVYLNGYLLLLGGWPIDREIEGDSTTEIDLYKLDSNNWLRYSCENINHRIGCKAIVNNQNVLVIGGEFEGVGQEYLELKLSFT